MAGISAGWCSTRLGGVMSSCEEGGLAMGLGSVGILQVSLCVQPHKLSPALRTCLLGSLASVVQSLLGQIAAVVLTIPHPTLWENTL